MPIEAIRPVAVSAAPAFRRGRTRRAGAVDPREGHRAAAAGPAGRRCRRRDFELVAGERRWRAAQRVGLHEVPVVVRALGDSRGDRDRAGREPAARGSVAARRGRGLQPADRANSAAARRASPKRSARAAAMSPTRCACCRCRRRCARASKRARCRPGTRGRCSARPTRRRWPGEVVRRGLNVRATESLVRRRARPAAAPAAAGARRRHAGARARAGRPRSACASRWRRRRRGGSLTLHYAEPRPARPACWRLLRRG